MEKFFLFAFFMKQENSMYRLSGSGFRVSPWGVLPLDCVRKRFSGFCRFYGFSGFSGEGASSLLSNFRVQGSGLAHGAARPLITDESFTRIRNAKLEMRNTKWWCGA